MADVLIRQFEVFANPERKGSSIRYIVVLQSSHVSDTRGVLAAPLDEPRERYRGQRLSTTIYVRGETLTLVVTEMAVVPRRLLREPIASVSAERDRIVLALDFLFTGV